MDKLEVKILDARIGQEIELPSYATAGSAAMDLRIVLDEPSYLLKAGASALFGTGIAIHIANPVYAALILPRSGLGAKHGIVLGNLLGLIDSDYQGELKLSLWNRSDRDYTLTQGERVAQLMLVPVARPVLQVVENFAENTARGAGGFGHTGTC